MGREALQIQAGSEPCRKLMSLGKAGSEPAKTFNSPRALSPAEEALHWETNSALPNSTPVQVLHELLLR